MSKRRGVSADEKRTRILQLFHEKKDFFQLKELEKIAPKEKGIIAQSVKDVVQSLVDDGLVDADKIGTSTYYWAYPNKAHKMKEKRLEEIEAECHKLDLQLTQTREALAMARASREESSMREETLRKIRELKEVKIDLETKMMTHADCNPRSVLALQEHIRKLKEEANRWTDNIYVVKSWCKNKFLIEGEAIDKHFGIQAELEYID